MYSIRVTDPSGRKRTYASGRAAAAAVGIAYDTLKKLANVGGYTRNGVRIEYMDATHSGRRPQLCVTIQKDLYNRLAAEAERRGVTVSALHREFIEQTIVEKIPLVSPQG